MLPPALTAPRDVRLPQGDWRRLLAGRRGWFGVVRSTGRVDPVFVWVFDGTTFIADMGLRPAATRGTYTLRCEAGLQSALVPLAACTWHAQAVFEVVIVVDVQSEPQTFRLAHNWKIRVPKPCPRSKARDADGAEPRASRSARSDDESAGSSSVSDRERSDASGPVPEVATDLDSGVDVPPDPHARKNVSSESNVSDDDDDDEPEVSRAAAGAPCRGNAALGAEGGSDDEDPEVSNARRLRHPPGTWTVWEHTFFYMTQTHGKLDIKMHVKGCLRGGARGMQPPLLSRTLTPAMYGPDETPTACPRTKFLLRCWCVWRLRQDGWAERTKFRRQELAALIAAVRLEYEDLRPLAPGPILGSEAGERKALLWAPDVFSREGSKRARRARD